MTQESQKDSTPTQEQKEREKEGWMSNMHIQEDRHP
jgi:hypothetical protein